MTSSILQYVTVITGNAVTYSSKPIFFVNYLNNVTRVLFNCMYLHLRNMTAKRPCKVLAIFSHYRK